MGWSHLFLLSLWLELALGVPKIDKGPSYKMSHANDIIEEDLAVLIRSIFSSLSEKIGTMQQRLERVEERTEDISDRLNLVDCYDVKVNNPLADSGMYSFHLDYKGKRPVNVYCDMVTDGGGWTVIQQRLPREENSTVHPTDFNRGFHEYQVGFGEPDRDYWIGLENIFLWTNSRQHELRVELSDFKQRKASALYSFYIDGEDKGYIIHASDYKGDAGDALSGIPDNFTADGMMFSTLDQDFDTSEEINCSKFWSIGGWWFNRCSWANLNGPYKTQEEKDNCTGINWHKWRNNECLKSAKMMIRPKRT